MRIFKNKEFNKWARLEGLTAEDLRNAAQEVAIGRVEASLGGKVFKKRIGVSGQGKSGGVRTILAFQSGKHMFFIYGFAKNKRANISNKELKALQKIAAIYLNYTDRQLNSAVQEKILFEIKVKESG
jgi:hypothetical protein